MHQKKNHIKPAKTQSLETSSVVASHLITATNNGAMSFQEPQLFLTANPSGIWPHVLHGDSKSLILMGAI